jgi:hypothetical protein
MGHYPQSLNIPNHSFNRPEYIETFCLLAKAAADILPGETCIARRNYDDGFQVAGTRPVQPQEPEREKKPHTEEHKKKKKPSWWEKLRTKAGEMLSEDDVDDE